MITGTLLFLFCFGMLVFPQLQGVVVPWIIAPDFFVELAVALWLTFKGIYPPMAV